MVHPPLPSTNNQPIYCDRFLACFALDTESQESDTIFCLERRPEREDSRIVSSSSSRFNTARGRCGSILNWVLRVGADCFPTFSAMRTCGMTLGNFSATRDQGLIGLSRRSTVSAEANTIRQYWHLLGEHLGGYCRRHWGRWRTLLACSGGSTQLQLEPCWLLGIIPTGTSPTSWRTAGSHRMTIKFAALPPQQSRLQGSWPSLSKHEPSKISAWCSATEGCGMYLKGVEWILSVSIMTLWQAACQMPAPSMSTIAASETCCITS